MREKDKNPLEGFLPKRAIVMVKKNKKISRANLKRLVSDDITNDSIDKITHDLIDCKRCKLCEKRNLIVVGDGNPKAKIVLVGEAPGEQEDINGIPFVGRAGQLLDKMLAAISLDRSKIYICNTVKCRPPENRNPEPDEIESCAPYLARQLAVISPDVIIALGKFASQTLLKSETPISQLRGQFFDYQLADGKVAQLIPTFHPAYLLRNPSAKKEVWIDLQMVADKVGLKILGKV